VHALFPKELADVFRENDLKVIRERVPLQFEEPAMHEDGLHTYLSTKFPLLDDEGNAQAICTISTDITDRKRFEDELQRARDEADRASHAKSEFLSRMSHELRTPLNAILGFAQILELDTELDTEGDGDRESVDQILRAGRHLLELINEVLDISRIESGRLSISTEPVEVSTVIEECVQLIRLASEQRHIELKVNLREVSEKYVLADCQRLKQVVLNLLSNAVKYNRDGGNVMIGCEVGESETFRLKIRDTGYGISLHDVERLFSPFERLQADRTTIEGTGLGLALSKRLVELMGGRIGVKSTPNEGSLFWIELPQTESPLQRLERNGGADAFDLEERADSAWKSLLYIEDNLSNLHLIERIFEKRPRIKLLAAMQGEIGLNLARQHRPDLVLLDVNLPDMSGPEVLRRLRGEKMTCDIPIVVVSADATRRQIDHLLAAGASDYLIKPLEVRKFLSVVDKLLDQPKSSVATN
jgi:signal transduction histidine kinase/ActR/RegA family two-component response regulator